MGDRHGGRFARRGRTLNPPRPQVDAHRGVGFRWRATVFRCRGVVGRICPRENAPLGEGLPTRRTSERIYPRRNTPLGEGLPTRRTSERICPAQKHAPRRRPPDTAHERKDLPRARALPTAKVSRHGARAKGFAPRENALLGEGLPTRRTSERICPARERSPRRKPPDTAHEPKDLPRARTLSTAKASRHGARAKGFAPRRNTPLDEGLPTRRTSERICPAQDRSPRRRPPDTAHGRKDLPRPERSPRRRPPDTAHERKDLPAQELAPRRRHPDTAHERKDCPAGVRVRPTCRRTAGRPRPTDSRKNTPSAGSHPQRAAAAEFIHRKKIRLLHETQFFYGESHVGSPHLFPSVPSVGRCVARERNPVPPVAPHRGSEHRGLRRTDEMVRRFDAMCPHGSEWLPRGGRCDPSLRYFGERFHQRRCANPDACRGRRCSRDHDDLGQRAFRYFRSAFRNRRRSGE